MRINFKQIQNYKKFFGMEENTDEEGALEPQITSLDPNERKLARRLRIQERLQKANQQQQFLNGCQELEVDNRTMLEKQLEISEGQLEKLLLDGKELVTNVRIANDAREVKRRKDEVAAREKRLKRLEDQANESVEKFNEVSSRWKVILETNDPLDLHHDIEEQKVKYAELIAQKDMLIKELKTELKLADERFDKDQKKQKEDLWLLTERIENQVKVMRKAYKEELKLIEEVIELEHKQLVEVNEKKWEALYNKHEKLEVEHMEKKSQAVDEYEDEIYRVAAEHHEKFREVKIKLETDIQVLQQELELVKAQCLMNSEKLVYNFQVLKKREEENLIVRAQQKRKINRLQDVVNNLKKKIAKTEESTKTESAQLTEEVMRLHHNILDIEKKADHFAEVNDRKYQQVWELNKDTAKKLLDKILDIDHILHEQQLGLEWTGPDLSLLHHEDLVSYRSAMRLIADLFPEKDTHGTNGELKSVSWPMTKEDMEKLRAKERLLRNILKLVAENSDFLVEQKLNELLGPHNDKKKMLIKIDSIFTALGIKTEAEIMMLKKCFLPYAKCSVCSTPMEEKMTTMFRGSHESIGSTSTAGDTETAEAGMVLDTSIVKFGEDPAQEEQRLQDMDVTASEATSTPVKSVVGVKAKLHLSHSKPGCSETHPLVIDPVYVLKGLRNFAAKFSPKQHSFLTNLTSNLSVKRSTVSRLLSTQDVTAFWTRFREIFSPQEEKLWDGLLIGLQMYHRILEDRHKLNVETEQLRRKNAELRRLLHFYIQNPEDESVFLSSREHLPPISRNYLHKKSKMKFAKAAGTGRKST